MTRLEDMQGAAETEDNQVQRFDREEIIENCTVQILTDTNTGEISIGWWRGTAKDMPEISRVVN